MPPEADPRLMSHSLIVRYANAAKRHRWAWDGLVGLLYETKGDEPPVLAAWACAVMREARKAPRKGNEDVHEKDARIRFAFNLLRQRLKYWPAIGELADATGIPDGTIKSAVDRMT